MKTYTIGYRLDENSEFQAIQVSACSMDDAVERAFDWIDDVFELDEVQRELVEIDDNPIPWCSACGAKTPKKCKCGRIADNDLISYKDVA